MNDNFLRVAAATPKVTVANPIANRTEIVSTMRDLAEQEVDVVCFPELAITGYTCGDLFLQSTLLQGAEDALRWILEETEELPLFAAIGLPVADRGKLYNAIAMVQSGKLLGIVPKTNIPNYAEFYELRHFAPGPTSDIRMISYAGHVDVPFGTDLLFDCENQPGLVIGAEICEDLWTATPPSSRHALAGATLILNASASNEVVGKRAYRKNLVRSQSARTITAYVYANAGEGESTTDTVFSGHNLICESNQVLAETPWDVSSGYIVADVDLDHLDVDRRRTNTFHPYIGSDEISALQGDTHHVVTFQRQSHALSDLEGAKNVRQTENAPEMENALKTEKATKEEKGQKSSRLLRPISAMPFVPDDPEMRDARAEEILTIQARGLAKRMAHIGSKKAVLGISGGLDSTLALLVTRKAFDLLGLDHAGIECITMPSFGTTDRTYQNALKLIKELGATLHEIDIEKSVKQHLEDIGLSLDDRSTAFENAQARERTQVLMDFANKIGGLVVGTGDLSELALGWATYNGDHMSMYGVNAGVPKTLVRHLVTSEANRLAQAGQEALQKVLLDVVDTPVSPELLPSDDGKIQQKTEDHVGPYELQDFTLYYALRYGYGPQKIFRMQRQAFAGKYDDETLIHWMGVFFRRFFTQQFKRSCLPDGPKVGSVSLSPRSDWRMPSDASYALWLEEIESLRSGR